MLLGELAKLKAQQAEQKEMMAYWYRKQEEQKKLEAAVDDEYLNSDWADPRKLKSQFNGVGDVRWR